MQSKLNNDFIDKKRYREIKHDKYYDNIIFKKIKNIFINKIIIFINTVIEICLNKEKDNDSMNKNIIKDLDYESIKDNKNKKKNMEIIEEIIMLVDIRHKPTENDLLMLNYIKNTSLPYIIIANKADKIAVTKELMSKDINPKYKTLEKDYNKKIIDELLNNKTNDCNTEILVYVFNLKVIK